MILSCALLYQFLTPLHFRHPQVKRKTTNKTYQLRRARHQCWLPSALPCSPGIYGQIDIIFKNNPISKIKFEYAIITLLFKYNYLQIPPPSRHLLLSPRIQPWLLLPFRRTCSLPSFPLLFLLSRHLNDIIRSKSEFYNMYFLQNSEFSGR